MKKVFTLILLSGCFIMSFAQRRPAEIKEFMSVEKDMKAMFSANRAADTVLFTNLEEGDSLRIFSYVDINNVFQGFITGHNDFGDQGFAERFDNSESIKILAAIANVAAFNIQNPTAQSYMRVYSPSSTLGNSLPSALLATDSVAYSQFDPQVSETLPLFVFGNQPEVSGDFFVSFELQPYNPVSNQDTLVLVHSDQSTRPASDTTTFRNAILWSDNTWNDLYTQVIDLQAHLDISVLVEFPDVTSNDAFIQNYGLTLYPAYPNPAENRVNLRYALKNAEEVEVIVYDYSGRALFSRNLGIVPGGENEYELDTQELTSGNYFYLIKSTDGMLGSRFVIVR